MPENCIGWFLWSALQLFVVEEHDVGHWQLATEAAVQLLMFWFLLKLFGLLVFESEMNKRESTYNTIKHYYEEEQSP